MMLFFVTFVFFAVVMFGLSVGVVFGHGQLRGHCGGKPTLGERRGDVGCAGCSGSGDHCESDSGGKVIVELKV